MSLENLKLSKTLTTAMLNAGYLAPKEIQAKTISRILGGQNMIGVGPTKSGKTTAYVLAVLMRLKGPVNGAPRALILVPTREKLTEVADLFKWMGKHTGIRISCLTGGLIGEQYMEAIEDGLADIVIGTPDKINALYVKSLLNLRSLLMFVVDDTEAMMKLNQQATIYNLAEGLTKCQRLVFSEVMNDKLNRLTDHLMPTAALAEVELLNEPTPDLIDMVLYKVSNYKTKLNLLELILRDSETFKKVAVFVNTRATAETLYNNLKKRLGKSVSMLNIGGFDTLEVFKESEEARIIVLSGEDQPSFNLLGIPYIFHMEIPSSKEVFIKRVVKLTQEEKANAVSITFATHPEQEVVRKIEQLTGRKMKEEKLPEGLPADDDKKKKSDPIKEIPTNTKSDNSQWDWKIK